MTQRDRIEFGPISKIRRSRIYKTFPDYGKGLSSKGAVIGQESVNFQKGVRQSEFIGQESNNFQKVIHKAVFGERKLTTIHNFIHLLFKCPLQSLQSIQQHFPRTSDIHANEAFSAKTVFFPWF